MVKYNDNQDFKYEQISLSTAYDLRNARIVQAQINSIDQANNCASITLSSECAELAGKSLDEVKFFYHCEYSSGTLEDLEHGHEAFVADDFVLVLWVPASGEVEEQFYVIGHIDQRGTKKCKNLDILLIVMMANPNEDPIYVYDDQAFPVNSTEQWITLFDCNTGATLDPLSIEPLADDSPPSPAEFPCLITEDVTAWVGYNFDISEASHLCPIVISKEELDGSPVVTTLIDDEGCSRMSRYQFAFSVKIDSKEYIGGDLELGKYYSAEVTRNRHEYQVPRGGWKLQDEVTNEFSNIMISTDSTLSGAVSASAGSQWSGALSTNVEWTTVNNITNETITTEVSSGTYAWGNSTSKIYWLEDNLYPSGYRNNNHAGITAVGSLGFYMLCTMKDTSWVINGWNTIPPPIFSAQDADDFCEILPGNPFDQINFDSFSPSINATTGVSNIFSPGMCRGFVTLFDDIDGDLEYVVSPFRCIRASNAALSRGLEKTYVDLKRKVFQRTVVKKFGFNDMFGTWAWLKPYNFEVLKKKTAA